MNLGNMEQRTAGMKRQAAELIEQAYNRGFKAGREYSKDWEKDQSDRLIEQGRNDAWECILKIVGRDTDCGCLSQSQLYEIFGTIDYRAIVLKYSPTEAIKRIREYEEKQKQKEDEEIHVWDEVQSLGEITGIVTYISETEGFNILWKDGSVGKRKNISDYKKTGRTFPGIAEVLKKLREDK